MSKTAFHSGCQGDAIFAIPSLKALNVTHLYFSDRWWTKPIESRLHAIKRLFEKQGITISIYQGELFDYDFSTFRNAGQLHGDPIVYRQSRWVGATVDLSKPWLIAEPDNRTNGRILISRGPRWQGYWFPWKQLVNTYREEMVFVGLDEDYQDFVGRYGLVERIKTSDLYEVAQLIAGSSLFIANQSSPNAICEGLQKDNVLEVCLHAPDCIYFRKNSTYVYDGALELSFNNKTFRSERLSETNEIAYMKIAPEHKLDQLRRIEEFMADKSQK